MIKLDPAIVDSGRLRLRIALIVAIALALSTAILYFSVPSFTTGNTMMEVFSDVLLWEPVVMLVMGLGTLQGGKAVRYIFTAIMVVLLLIQVELIYSGFSNSPFLTALFIFKWIASLLLIYFMIIDKAVNQYFLYQRAKNYGEWMGVQVEQSTTPQETRTTPSTSEQPRKEAPPNREAKPKKKSNWDEDLDLYE